MLKKIILILLSIQIAIMPTLIFAGAAEDYRPPSVPNTGNTGARGSASNDPNYNPPKISANDPEYFPKRRPSVGAVAKVLKVGNAIALGQAVVDILGHGVDWILDPNNNRIKYNVETGEWVYSASHISLEHGMSNPNYPTSTNLDYVADLKCKEQYKSYNASYNGRNRWDSPTSNSGSVGCILLNPDGSEYGNYATSIFRYKPKKENHISLEQVAGQVLRNADKGHQPSINTANQAIREEAKANPKEDPNASPNPKDDPNASPNPKDDPNANPKDEENPKTGESELPEFCTWAKSVCDFIDWAKSEPELKDEQLEIKEQEITQYQHINHVRFGQNCPFTPTNHSISLGVGSFDFTADLTFICDFGHQARGTIIGVGYLLSLIFLIRGLRGT